MQPTNIPQQPNPIQLAMQNQQPNAAQQLQQQTQQADVQQQAEQQQAGMIKDSAAIDLQQQQATISKAMAQLNPKADSGNKAFDTASKVGQAIASPAYAGYCQQFADDTTGSKERYPTAFATWQAKVQQGSAKSGTSGMKPGDVVEFAPDKSNGNLGHAAVVQKDGSLKMATYNGVQTFSLKDWTTHTGQQPLGYYSPSK